MLIDRKTILKVANLARLSLSESEIEKMKIDLNSILNYVDQLNSVDTEGVKPLVSVLDVDTVQTNILVFDVAGTGLSASELADRLEERRVLAGAMDNATMRLVTHYDVDDAGIEQSLAAMK